MPTKGNVKVSMIAIAAMGIMQRW